MEITRLEKAALITTGAAAAYKTLLWSLEASVTSTDWPIVSLRIVFAFVSFAAFDLVLMAVVARGWSWSGATALLIAAGVSAAIGLDVGGVGHMPGLHAAPAVTLAAFGLHLMLCRPQGTGDREQGTDPHSITQAVQVNVAPSLPATVAAYIAAKAAELPDSSPNELAQLLGVGSASVRKVLQIPSEQEPSI